MKLNMFDATTPIFGKDRHVAYNPLTHDGIKMPHALMLFDLTLEEALKVLEVLRLGTTTPITDALKTLEAPTPTPAAEAAPAAKKKAAPKAAPAAKVAPAAPAAPEPVEAEVEVPSEEDPFAADTAPVGEASTHAEPGEIPEAVLKTDKLRDVLLWAYDSGATSTEAIIQKCKELTPKIPLLGRVSNLEDRVKRAVTVLGLAVTDKAA